MQDTELRNAEMSQGPGYTDEEPLSQYGVMRRIFLGVGEGWQGLKITPLLVSKIPLLEMHSFVLFAPQGPGKDQCIR